MKNLHRSVALLQSALVLAGLGASFPAFAEEATSPYGNRAEEIDISNTYHPPRVYVQELEQTTVDGTSVSGTFRVRNSEEDLIAGLGYRIEIYDRASVQNGKEILHAVLAAQVLSPLAPQEERNETFTVSLPALPKGLYSLRVQLLQGDGRQLGWGTTDLDVKGVLNPIGIRAAGIELPEFDNTVVDSTTGPNVNPGSTFVIHMDAENANNVPVTVTPVLRTFNFDPARGEQQRIAFEPITLKAHETRSIPLTVSAGDVSQVTLGHLTLEQNGQTVSAIAPFRWIVRGLNADIVASKIQSLGLQEGDATFVHVDYVGPADAELQTTGWMDIALRDAQGTVGAARVMDISLSDGLRGIAARIPMTRDAVSDPVLHITIHAQDGTLLASSDSPITLTASQTAAIEGKDAWKLTVHWFTQWSMILSFLAFIGVLTGMVAASIVALRYPGTLQPALAALLILALAGSSATISYAEPANVEDAQANLQGITVIYARNSGFGPFPVVSMFINKPEHNAPAGTYQCDGSVPLEYKLVYVVCYNVPAVVRVIGRVDTNGGKHANLQGDGNSAWLEVHDRNHFYNGTTSCPLIDGDDHCLWAGAFNGNVNLSGVDAGVSDTTLQLTAKWEHDTDERGIPNDNISPTDFYIANGLAQVTNVWLNCQAQPSCGNATVEEGEECDDGNNSNGDACTNECKKTTCGDGTVQNPNGNGQNEQCDDGNTNNDDQCTNQCTIPAPKADVTVVKNAAATIQRGEMLWYELIVTNNGATAADNVTITDAIPAGITYNDAQSDVRCNQSGNDVVCQLGTLAPNQSTNVRIAMQTNGQTACGNVRNVAVVSTTTVESNTGNNQDDANTNVLCPASSSSSKPPSSSSSSRPPSSSSSSRPPSSSSSSTPPSSSSQPPQFGCIDIQKEAFNPQGTPLNTIPQFTFKLDGGAQTMNDSAGHAKFSNVTPGSHTVSEVVPPGWINSNVTPIGGTVNVVAGPNCAGVVFKNLQVLSSSSSSLPPSSSSSSTPPSSSSSSVGKPDLTIVKHGALSIQRGEILWYEIFVSNAGNAAAHNVTLTDVIPSGVTYDDAKSDTRCEQNGNSVVCNLGTMQAGVSNELVRIAFLTGTQTSCGTMTNTAQVSTSTSESNTSNNTSTFQGQILCPSSSSSASSVGAPKMEVEKSVQSTVQAGSNVTYTIRVKNSGTATEFNAYINDYFVDQNMVPIAMQFNFVSATGAICASHPTHNGFTSVNCEIGNVPADNLWKTFTMTFNVPNNPSLCGKTLTNRIDSWDYPNDTIFDSATAATTVLCASSSSSSSTPPSSSSSSVGKPDLTIVKHGALSIQRGEILWYEIFVSNSGNVAAQNVTLTDVIPSGVTYSDSQSDNRCNQNGNSVTCNLGTMQPGAPADMVRIAFLTSTQTACGTMTNTAQVSTSTTESNTGNNASTFQGQILCPSSSSASSVGTPKIEVEKSVPSTVQAGSNVTYTIRVKNSGTATEFNAYINDYFVDQNQSAIAMPFTFVSAAGAICASHPTHNGQTSINCEIGNVPADNIWKTFSMTFNVPNNASLCGKTLTNRVDSWDYVHNKLFDSATAATTVLCASSSSSSSSSTPPSSSSSSSSTPPSSSSSSSSSTTPMGCIDITKEAFDVSGNLLSVVPQFTFTLDGSVQTVNGSNGLAKFLNVPAGQHTVTEVVPSGWQQHAVTPAGGTVNVPAGNCASVNFKNRQTTSSSSSSSSNTSSSSSSSSTGFGCIEVNKFAYDVNGNQLGTVPQFTFTLDGNRSAFNDSNGRARFDNVAAGTHTVIESLPSGWTLQSVSPNNGTVSVNAGSSCAQANFTNRQNSLVTDFSISKTDHETEVEPGDELTYEITVKNNSNQTVTNVTVTDNLPDEVIFDSCTNNCSRNGRTLTWTNLTFGPNEEKKLYVDVEVDDDADDTLFNTAYVFNKSATDETDVDDDDVDSDEDEDLELELEKHASTAEVFPGGIIEYTVRIENTGDSTIEDLTVTDTLPFGVTIIDDGDADDVNGRELEWEIDELDEGDDWTAHYRVVVDPSTFPGTILRNEVCTEHDENDLDDECESVTVGVIGNMPQTGFRGAGATIKLRSINKTAGHGSTNVPFTVWLSLIGIGSGAGLGIGRRFLFGI